MDDPVAVPGRRIKAEIAGIPLDLKSRPGFAVWHEVDVSSQLLAENARVTAKDTVLIFPSGHGALGLWAHQATPASRVYLYDSNCVAAGVAAENSRQIADSRLDVLPSSPFALPSCDVVLMRLPKGRRLARLYLWESYRALRPGGLLLLAGPKSAGIKGALSDAEKLFGSTHVLAYRKGHRVAGMAKPDAAQAIAPELFQAPGIASGSYHRYRVTIAGVEFEACSRPGVFSWQSLDRGTEMLVRSIEPTKDDHLLDIGCGCGIIAAYAQIKARCRSTLVDVDAIACESARETMSVNGLDPERVILGDSWRAVADQRFSLVVSNPPFHSGHDISYDMVKDLIEHAPQLLQPAGRLILVANRFLPYDRLMNARFGNVKVLARSGSYHVLSSQVSKSRRNRQRRPR